ncbi:hypothetical protein K493DRAFT_296742 [Basidiobolus meristosporus CBS 931.73]|uniref:Uncharacterized protein n=1 Tax=Basidiobolus meristosporus CBS 931.73 TaxID=1314790 RepID=A0A1Y1Z466_9FUNG|nr:hypothetical protein K493DRAFT_296742 [Basidiobolus meristosporus CBS 931.73]|eukprot:ORY04914.1 hypothetical protein K493DRAFT_296742 [Basidiobolus meristosporus CBS 931.73]
MPLYLDRFYVAILASVATSCMINVRILVARRALLRTKAGIAHLFSNLFAITAGLILSINETTGLNIATPNTCMLQLSFGCAFVHLAKLLNHIILFWRCEVITHQHIGVRLGFSLLLLCKCMAVGSHCGLMRPFYNEIARLCLDTFEPVSTTATFVLDMTTDATLTGLFMIKIFQHTSQLRKLERPQSNQQVDTSSQAYPPEQSISMNQLFKEYLYQAVPTLLFSFSLNAIIVSNVLLDYTLIVVYTDLIVQLRLANDLLVLNRLSAGASNFTTYGSHSHGLKMTYDPTTPSSEPNLLLHKEAFEANSGINENIFDGLGKSKRAEESYELVNRRILDEERSRSFSIPRRADQTFPSALSPPPFKRTNKVDEEKVGLTQAQRTAYRDSHDDKSVSVRYEGESSNSTT